MNKGELVIEYNELKQKAFILERKGKYEEALHYIQFAARIAWHYPIIWEFVDEQLEFCLDRIVSKLNSKKLMPGSVQKNKIVFYAGQFIDKGALTEQYLEYLLNNKYEVLVIVQDQNNLKFGKNQIESLKKFKNLELFIPKDNTIIGKINAINKKLIEFIPNIVFLHFMPDDVIGYCTFTSLKHIRRYYIVHNDHTFWLGKNCSDYFLEFRNFGCNLSIFRRGIPQEKILKIPYYPIEDTIDFQGFPFNVEGKVIGVSGANFYKYLLDPELKYLKAIKQLMLENDNFVFCLCGWGEGLNKIESVFDDEKIRGRFYYLGKRKDFFQVVGHSDILFESYPLKGGLTFTFAAVQSKAIIGISNFKNASCSIEDWIDSQSYNEPVDLDNFIVSSDKLIKSKEARIANSKHFLGSKFNKLDFTNNLKLILEEKLELLKFNEKENISLDDEYYLNEYLNLLNVHEKLVENKIILLRKFLDFKGKLKVFIEIFKCRNFSAVKILKLTGKLFLNYL